MARVGLFVALLCWCILEVFAGESCPEHLHCVCSGKQVQCREIENAGQMTQVIAKLAKILPNTEDLTFTDTDVATLGESMFKSLKQLKKLRISRAEFSGTGISAMAFDGLDNLEELAVTDNENNPPMDLPFYVFAPLKNLKKLDLSKNNFAELPDSKVFNSLSGLEVLDLSHNRIGDLRSNGLQAFKSLKTLLLRSAGVRVVSYTSFTGLGAVEELDLSNNPSITLAADDALSQLKSLKILRLQANRMTEVRPDLFFSVKETLQTLDLSRNNFETLKDNVFKFLGVIRTLNLSSMAVPVRRIEPKAFAGLAKLVTLDLRHDRMSHLKVEPFKMIPQTHILFEDNRFFCNCKMAAVVDWLVKSTVKADVVCTVPFRLSGMSVSKLDPVKDIGCKRPKIILEERVRQKLGETVYFECGVEDHHALPQVSYRVVSGSPLPSNRTVVKAMNTSNALNMFTFKYVFTISGVTQEDNGKIECSGTGGFGSVKGTIDIFYGQEGLPLWVILTIIGGLVLVIGTIIIVVLVLRQRQKRRQKYNSVLKGDSSFWKG